MPKFYIKHITKYEYAAPVTDSANQVILKPESNENQDIINYSIKTIPGSVIEYYTDYFGNQIGSFSVREPHSKLGIVAEIEVVTKDIPRPTSTMPIAEQWQTLDKIENELGFWDFVKAESYASKAFLENVVNEISENKTKDVLATIADVCLYIYNNYQYQQGVTNVETFIDEIISLKAGVCQDFAHLMAEMLRLLKIPARYISGYLCPAGTSLRGEGATHAWIEAYVPGYGWVGVDPTNDCYVNASHVKIAYGRSFKDCTPVKGTYKGTSNHVLTVSVLVNKDKQDNSYSLLDDAPNPVYVSTVEEPEIKERNSYQRFIEMQQQQQQQ